MGYDLGIDVGTSYSAAAARTDDGAVTVIGLGPIADSIPTVLYLEEDGTMIVGDAANRRALLDPAGAAREFKRRLGDSTPSILRGAPFSAEALVAHMLRHVVDRVVDRQREQPRSIAVSHPANWGPYKMEIFGQALQMADLDDAILISEPAAAAVAYAAEHRVEAGSTVAVYDLGGGTFDTAILRKTDTGFAVLGEPIGLEHLGGIDFDASVFEYVRETATGDWDLDPDDPAHITAMSHLRKSCTEAKELLSSESDASIPVMLPGLEQTISLGRPEFEARIRPIVVPTINALEQAMVRARVSAADLSAILLVGGSSRIPLVAQLLREQYGDLVRVDVDPVHAVAKGGALAAAGVLDLSPPAEPLSESSSPVVPPKPPDEPVSPVPSVPDSGPFGVPAEASQAPMAAPVQPIAAVPPVAPVIESTSLGDPQQPVTQPLSSHAPQTQPVTPAAANDPGATDEDTSKRGRLILVGVCVLLLAILGTVALILNGNDDGLDVASGNPDPSEDNESEDNESASDTSDDDQLAPANVGAALAAPADGMVEVPAGSYPLGLEQPESNTSESFSQTVELNRFYLDELEVTNADYKAFVDQTGALPPAGWRGGTYPEAEADHPVEGVSYEWATAFCLASQKRLPTEAEWEAAARGSEGRVWPWGDDPGQVEIPSSDTYPSGSIAGNISPFGAYDMTGNAWEWVADSYDQRVSDDLRVLRGGQNGFLRETVTRLPVDPLRSSALKIAGFRCAADGIDPSATAGTFVDYTAPQRSNEPVVEPLAEGVQVYDDFSDATSGWTEFAIDGDFRFGYHPNEYFHLETRAPFREALALSPWRSNPSQGFDLRTTVFTETNLTVDEGTYAYGLALKFDETGRGLIFIVDERSSQWLICSREPSGEGPFADAGVGYELIEQSSRSIPARVTLGVVDLGNDEYQFKIDGAVVHTRTIPDFDGTATGLILLSYAGSDKAHIHFDDFQVNEIG